MNTDTIVKFPTPEESSADYLTHVLRDGACRLLAQAVEAEAASFLAQFSDLTTEDGLQCRAKS